MRTEDGHIIHRCLNGEPQAFGFLVDKYKDRVYALAYSKLKNPHDARDISQDIFIKAYEKLHTLRRWDNFSAWIRSITCNLCKDYILAKRRRPDRHSIQDQDSETLNHVSLDHYRRSMRSKSVYETLDVLPEPYRQVLSLYYLADMNTVEIATFLGVSPGSIRKRLSRARSHFRAETFKTVTETLRGRKLKASFILRIMETVKHIRIHPMPRSTALPWGILSAAGIMLMLLNLGSHLSLFSSDEFPGRIFSHRTDLPRQEAIPVDLLDADSMPDASHRQSDTSGRSVALSGISTFPGNAQEVCIVGGYAYVTDPGGRFHIFDISDPAKPSLIGSCDTQGGAKGIYVTGRYAYVSNIDYSLDGDPGPRDYITGLSIIDISDPTAPREVGFCRNTGAYDVQVVGDYAYVADGYKAGLRIMDVSDPSYPRQVGSYYTHEYALGVHVVGHYVYLANGADGLRVIDVSDPIRPRGLGRYDTRWAHQVQVVGDFAYLTDEEGLYVIDISNPMSLRKVGFSSTSGIAYGVQMVDEYAYVAAGGSGLCLIDVSDPSSPEVVSYYGEMQLACGVHVHGSLVFMADAKIGLLIMRRA